MGRNKGALPKHTNAATLRKEYHKRFCNVVMDQGRLGKSRAQMAAYIGVSRRTLATWERNHEDFKEALEIADDRALAYLETLAMKGLKLKHFQSALLNKLMASRYPKEYGEKSKLEVDVDAPLTVIRRVFVNPLEGTEHDRDSRAVRRLTDEELERYRSRQLPGPKHSDD
jgi:DNA-binding XRE family transcriptional regulator